MVFSSIFPAFGPRFRALRLRGRGVRPAGRALGGRRHWRARKNARRDGAEEIQMIWHFFFWNLWESIEKRWGIYGNRFFLFARWTIPKSRWGIYGNLSIFFHSYVSLPEGIDFFLGTQHPPLDGESKKGKKPLGSKIFFGEPTQMELSQLDFFLGGIPQANSS